MEDVIVDFCVDVFGVYYEAVYVEDAGADWWEDAFVDLELRHLPCEVINVSFADFVYAISPPPPPPLIQARESLVGCGIC